MIARATPRGQPLLMLGLVLGGWIVLRAALWEVSTLSPVMLDEIRQVAPRLAKVKQAPAEMPPPDTDLAELAPGWSIRAESTGRVGVSGSISREQGLSSVLSPGGEMGPTSSHFAENGPVPGPGPVHNPPSLALAAAPFEPPQYAAQPSVKRWSGDAWLLMRGDGAGNLAAGRGSYGASQAGAVLRFSVLPDSPHRPAIYVRASKAISGAKEAEGALGVSLRPFPSIPLRAAAELRAGETSGQTELRAAAYVVTELPPMELPLAFRGEAYAQGGYVGGNYPSAFVDGQLRVDRTLATLGGVEIRAGGGVWGGAQKGAERLDIGPGATLAFDTGPANARVSVDWRHRIAGDAMPASGPALTVSAGF